MNWGSASEFFAMGGYGFYVWGSFGVTAAALLIETLLARKRLADTRRLLRRELAADSDNQD
ncbi:MAG: heme exporter protein CcmD [Zoogloea sp.]|nr:heme exporter protein CcmD [Zoogloea sp.]